MFIMESAQYLVCLVSNEDGSVHCFDIRMPSTARLLWRLEAHKKACTGVTDCQVENMIMTTSLDGTAKVWDITGGSPNMVFQRNLKAGPIFCVQSSPDEPHMFSFGASCVVLWDVCDTPDVVKRFNLAVTDE